MTMDGIQGYSGPSRTPSPLHAQVISMGAPHSGNAHPTGKTPSDYLRALRRRFWVVLAIGVPLSVMSGILIAFQPNIYSAQAQIVIEPPHFDPVLSSLVSREVGHQSPEAKETYAPNRIAMLRTRKIAELVVNDPSLTHGGSASEEAADELISSVQTRLVPGTNQYTVTLEGRDASRVAKSLQLLIDAFKNQASEEINEKIDAVKSSANDYLTLLNNDVAKYKNEIYDILKTSDTIGPGGTNLKQTQYENLSSTITNDYFQLRDLHQQAYLQDVMPNSRFSGASSPFDAKRAQLEELREKYSDNLLQLKGQVRNFDSDPATRYTANKLKDVIRKMKRLDELDSQTSDPAMTNPYHSLADNKEEEIRQKEETRAALLAEVKASMPKHQQFADTIDKIKLKSSQIAEMEQKLWQFGAISQSKKDPVVQVSNVVEPSMPIRPKRAFNMVFALIVSFGLGVGLVCALEHIDHSVKAPEQLTAGLSLPLFGVIPRIRRSALTHRGGHLWTPGAPDSIEADAFRNLRASLLGVTDKSDPIVTLLVTSAKAGEGKSTTALNLAATCARAGERTLLMDVDLRRPSLAEVFQELDDDASGVGLVDVLRGDLPWQRTVVRTELPNLDFLPTGDTTGIPIEILGALELRQLLIGLSNHYDRVILDGPAILGLADCRMLGRIVDAALLVVRSGSQELRPLQHAKTMLEQSHVVIAGVVFNGLFEDLKNWSSYGPETPSGYTSSLPGRSLPPGRGLDAPADDDAAALPMASTI